MKQAVRRLDTAAGQYHRPMYLRRIQRLSRSAVLGGRGPSGAGGGGAAARLVGWETS